MISCDRPHLRLIDFTILSTKKKHRFGGTSKNFKLYYDGQHFVGEKRFDTIHDLVADGLIILHLELHAKDYINSLGSQCKYEESPYMTIHRGQRNQRKKASELSKAQRKAAFEIKRISIHEADLEEEEPDAPGGERPDDDSIDRFSADHLDPQFDVQLFEKRHAFRAHNFMGLPFCDFCGNFMWGILGQGVKCDGGCPIDSILWLDPAVSPPAARPST